MDKPTQMNLEMLSYVANQVFSELEEKEKSGSEIARQEVEPRGQKDNQMEDEERYRSNENILK